MIKHSWKDVFEGPSDDLLTTFQGNANEYYNEPRGAMNIDDGINYYELNESVPTPSGGEITGFGVTKRASCWKVWLFNYDRGRLCSPRDCEYGDDYHLVLDSSNPSSEEEAIRQAKENFREELP